MGSVNITLANGQLGATLQTNDGIAGMVLTGNTEFAGYTAGVPILVTSLQNMVAQGISLAGNPFAYRQVNDFYTEAGAGAQLYLMLVPPTIKVNQMADRSNTSGAKKLLDFAAGKIKLLGIMSDDTVAYGAGLPLTTNSVNQDVYYAIDGITLMAADYFNAEKPFRCIVGGTSYMGTPVHLTDETAATYNNRTAILIGDTQSGKAACLGLLLGRLAAVPVQRKVSRVRTGPLSATAAYLGTAAVETLPADMATIAGRGYITFKTYANVSGYFFSGDDTCSALTDDYHYLCRGRVIDKVHVLAYSTFVQEVDDEVPVNTDGTLDAGFCKWLSQQIENQVNSTMTANNEISSVSCYINPAQNILATSQLNVALKIVPVGYATSINISLSFNNPAH